MNVRRPDVGGTGKKYGWDVRPGPIPAVTYRCFALPSGELLPIEERLGRRVLRRIDPESPLGRRLLAAQRVVVVEARGDGGAVARDH